MAKASFKDFDFEYGIKSLGSGGTRSLQKNQYPNNDGAEVEDLGSAPRQFDLEFLLPATAAGTRLKDKLEMLYREGTPGVLFLPGTGLYTCFIESFTDTQREGGGGLREVKLTFVEHLTSTLALQTFSTEETKLASVQSHLEAAETVAAAAKDETAFDKMKKVYGDAIGAISKAKTAVAAVTQKLQDIRSAVQRPFNEIAGLAVEIENVANELHGLARDLAKYPTLPYTLIRRLKNAGNTLTLIGRAFTTPSRSTTGEPLTSHVPSPVLTHRVFPGETLESVAVDYYGSTEPAPCLAEWNGKRTPTVRPGELLIIPPFKGKAPRSRAPIAPKVTMGGASCSK